MSERRSQDQTGEHGLHLLLEITVLLGADMAADLRRRGLTQSRVRVLWALGALGPSTQRVLADEVGVSPRGITGLVDALVETGFVTREPHPTDGRAFLVTPTNLGRAAVEALQTEAVALADQLFGTLPAQDLAPLVTGLDHVAQHLRALVEQP